MTSSPIMMYNEVVYRPGPDFPAAFWLSAIQLMINGPSTPAVDRAGAEVEPVDVPAAHEPAPVRRGDGPGTVEESHWPTPP